MEEAKDEELIKLRQELSNNAIENSSLSLRLKSQNEQSKPTKVFHVCLWYKQYTCTCVCVSVSSKNVLQSTLYMSLDRPYQGK